MLKLYFRCLNETKSVWEVGFFSQMEFKKDVSKKTWILFGNIYEGTCYAFHSYPTSLFLNEKKTSKVIRDLHLNRFATWQTILRQDSKLTLHAKVDIVEFLTDLRRCFMSRKNTLDGDFESLSKGSNTWANTFLQAVLHLQLLRCCW